MKKKLSYLFILSIMFSTIGCSGGNTPSNESSIEPELSSTSSKVEDLGPVDVVIISGQSNAVGCTKSICIPDTLGAEKYDEFFTGYPEIQIAYDCWTKDWPATGITFFSQNKSKKNDFVKTALGQGNSNNTFGPEIGIAEELHEKYANKLFLIKFACGGSNLKDDWLDRKSPMYPRLVEYVNLQMNNLVSKGYTPTIKAFCWMQGEGDTYPGYYLPYQDNLREFVSHIREDFKDLAGNKEIPFIDAGISNASVWEYSKQVNAAKVAFAEESENNIFIDTIAAGMHTDKEPEYEVDECHYDSDSEVLLGHLFAQAFEKFLG